MPPGRADEPVHTLIPGVGATFQATDTLKCDTDTLVDAQECLTVTASVAGLDDGFERVFVLLAGGNLADVVLNGSKDAANVREDLEKIGIKGEQIRELTRPIEPLRLAHRIDSEHLWLYSGKFDDVVPPASSFALATAAKLPDGHHIELLADHYSGVVFLPMVIQEIRKKMDDGSGIGVRSE